MTTSPLRRLPIAALLTGALALPHRVDAGTGADGIQGKWRRRLPVQIEKRLERLAAWRAAGGRTTAGPGPGDLPRRRGERAGTVAAGLSQVGAGFHAAGLAECEPLPINPLLDPLGLFEDETDEGDPIGEFGRLAFVDFDSDGDLDLFVGDKYGAVRYFVNVAPPGQPAVYEEAFGDPATAGDEPDNPAFGISVGAYSAPAVVDIDGDGSLELFVGKGDGTVGFYELDANGQFVVPDVPGTPGHIVNPLDGLTFGEGNATPFFVDWDDDDDLDVFVGTKKVKTVEGETIVTDGEVFYLENTGTDTAPTFVDQTDVVGVDPLAGFGFGYSTAPAVVDFDGDGDLDVFVGDKKGLRYFRNDGGTLVETSGAEDPTDGSSLIYAGGYPADLDGDGDLDLFVTQYGHVGLFENTGTPADPGFLSMGPFLEFFDFDGDGLLDVFTGGFNYSGVAHFLNTGTAQEPSWERRVGTDNPFSVFNATAPPPGIAPTVGNIDADPALEAFVGMIGTLVPLEQDVAGRFVPTVPVPGVPGTFGGTFVDPQLVDLDGDGDLDLAIGYSLSVYDPGTMTTSQESYVAIGFNDGAGSFTTGPVIHPDRTGYAFPFFVDVDGDGDLDLFLGGGDPDDSLPIVEFFENTAAAPGGLTFGTVATAPVEVFVGAPPTPALADLNGDGELDLYIGSGQGTEVFLTSSVTVIATPDSGLVTDEGGGTATFDVTLDRAPQGTVVVDLASSDLTEGTVSPAQLVFDATNFDEPQTVTVTGQDDALPDGPVAYEVTFALGAGNEVGCVALPVVALTNLDDETPSLQATKAVTGGDLLAGGTVVYTVVITNTGGAAQPDLADPEFTDTLPSSLTLDGATVVSGPGTASTSGNTVRWDGALAVDESVTIEITATIDPAATPGQVISNQGTALFDADQQTGTGNEASAPTDDPATAPTGDATQFEVGGADGPPTIVEIPTLGHLGAGLLAALLSLLGVFGIRRRG